METAVWRILGCGSALGLLWCFIALVRQFRGHKKIPALLAVATGVPLALLAATMAMYIVYYLITGERIREFGASVGMPTIELAALSAGTLLFSLVLSWPVAVWIFRRTAGLIPVLSAVVIVLLHIAYYGFVMIISGDIAAILSLL